MAFKSLCVAVAVLYLYRLANSQDCDMEFTLRPEDVVAGAGEMAMMKCEYTSTSGTEVVQWDFEGTAIFAEDPPCGCSIDTEDGTLQFSNITADDAGEYTCVVMSGFNTFRCSATLRLEEAPVISSQMGPGDVTFERRELSAFVTGTPIPDVEWRHDGEVIDGTSARITTTSVLEGGGRRETLTISDIEADNRGLYTLHASNTAGTAVAEWKVLVIFGMVEEVETDETGSVVRLTCRGQVYSEVGEPEVSWLRGGEMVASEGTMLSALMFHKTFVTSLEVDISTCMGNTEVVTCELMYVNAVGGEESIQKDTSVCDCSSPEVTASVKNCSDVVVDLKGNVGSLEYRSQDSSMWTAVVPFETSADTVTISGLDADTVYIVRATAPCSPSAFATSSVTTHSSPPPVTGVNAVAIYNSSGTFITVTWEESSAAGRINYHIKWSSEGDSGTQDLSPTTGHFGLAIVCDKTYEFQVMAVNICGRGTFSAPVQQMCVDAPPPLRVELHEVTFRSRESEDYLSLSFSLKDINMVLMVRVDVLEQDDNFITHRTLNYTIDEEVYREGSVCVTGLSNSKAPYLVCLRVTYDSGVDSTCSRPGEVEEDIQGDTSCLLPSSTRQVGNRDGAADARAVPEWGIAVIVVGALLIVALLFCFLGMCFACQTSHSKNVNFGSASSINTERGGTVVPTNIHMHNPSAGRAVSPTRSCLKYKRGHSTTWNDHVDTLRQMETDKGTHV